MRPLEPVSPTQRVTYGIAFFVVFVALWSWATFGGYVSKTFLANPLTMLQEGWDLLKAHFGALEPGGYAAFLAYIERNEAHETALSALPNSARIPSPAVSMTRPP